MVLELATRPHISFDFTLVELFAFADYGVVCQMHAFIVDLRNVIVNWRKSNIALVVDPYGQWVPVCDQHPLSYIELLPLDQQWVLDVFLHYI